MAVRISRHFQLDWVSLPATKQRPSLRIDGGAPRFTMAPLLRQSARSDDGARSSLSLAVSSPDSFVSECHSRPQHSVSPVYRRGACFPHQPNLLSRTKTDVQRRTLASASIPGATRATRPRRYPLDDTLQCAGDRAARLGNGLPRRRSVSRRSHHADGVLPDFWVDGTAYHAACSSTSACPVVLAWRVWKQARSLSSILPMGKQRRVSDARRPMTDRALGINALFAFDFGGDIPVSSVRDFARIRDDHASRLHGDIGLLESHIECYRTPEAIPARSAAPYIRLHPSRPALIPEKIPNTAS